jgi:exodeoxyribonuclease V alpha subunit
MTDPAQPKLALGAPPTGEATLRGVVRGVVFASPDGRFRVVRVMALDGQEHVVVGDLGGVAAGEQVRATGRWEEHGTHGRQLRATALVPELPSTPEGIQRLLGSGFVDGIGAEMARRIVRAFGSATLDVIADHPERLREVEGIGPERARKIQETFRARRAESEVRAFLQAAGIGPALTHRILKKYGDATLRVVRENPFRLAQDVMGVGFKTADEIGRKLGIAPDDPRRAEGAVLHALVEATEDGHAALPKTALAERVSALGVPAERVEPAMRALAVAGLAAPDRALVYPPPLRDAELALSARLAAMLRAGVPPIGQDVLADPGVARALDPLNALQRDAVRKTLGAAVLVLTGGPGTGKTTTVRAVVAVMRAAGRKVALGAPTGRAAKRLTEATGEPARTLHRLLEWSPRLGRFTRDANTPIDAELVLVDEASMLDLVLASRLVAAVRPGARLVLVGDADQLPSVGPGTVLADLLYTPWVPAVRLTEVFRQAAASAIVRGAHAVLRGEQPPPSEPRAPGTVAPPEGELYFVRAEDAARAAEVLVEMVARRIPRSFGLDPLRDVQVLVPTHKGPLGAAALNAALQRTLNPAAKDLPAEGAALRLLPGDKVMQLRNDYDLEVWNGDIGVVLRADRETATVRIDAREVVFQGEARDALALAYCATIHKAQGSEYDAVVIGLHTSHFVLLNRPLIYTAITRARRLAVIVGSERALRLAVGNARTAERYGALRERLRLAWEASAPRAE